MAKWKVTFRGMERVREETVESDYYRDDGVEGRWVVFYRGETGSAVPVLRVRAEDVERIEEVRDSK